MQGTEKGDGTRRLDDATHKNQRIQDTRNATRYQSEQRLIRGTQYVKPGGKAKKASYGLRKMWCLGLLLLI
jgi:hypothetical protein